MNKRLDSIIVNVGEQGNIYTLANHVLSWAKTIPSRPIRFLFNWENKEHEITINANMDEKTVANNVREALAN